MKARVLDDRCWNKVGLNSLDLIGHLCFFRGRPLRDAQVWHDFAVNNKHHASAACTGPRPDCWRETHRLWEGNRKPQRSGCFGWKLDLASAFGLLLFQVLSKLLLLHALKRRGMCGTAAVVVKVNSITHGETTLTFDDFDAGMHCNLCSWRTFVAAQSLLLHVVGNCVEACCWQTSFPSICYAKDVISSLRSELTAIQCRSPSWISVWRRIVENLTNGNCKSDTDHYSGDIFFAGPAASNSAISLRWRSWR